ncbi:MAG: hypothetical protein PHC51_13140 [bacterium]|nr:hypothetical protein [bacterium]
MAGADIEKVFEQAAQSGGSILWLEDYLEELDSNPEEPYIPALFKVIAEHTWLWFNDDGKVTKEQAEEFLLAYINKEILDAPYSLDSGFKFSVSSKDQQGGGYSVHITNNQNNNNTQTVGDNNSQAVSSGSGQANSSISSFNQSYTASKARLVTGLHSLLSSLPDDYPKDLVNEVLDQLHKANDQASKEDAMTALGGLLVTLKGLSGSCAEIVTNLITVATPVLQCMEVAQPLLGDLLK